MEKRTILDIAKEYGDIKFQLGQVSMMKLTTTIEEDLEKEYEELSAKRFKLLDELFYACNNI